MYKYKFSQVLSDSSSSSSSSSRRGAWCSVAVWCCSGELLLLRRSKGHVGTFCSPLVRSSSRLSLSPSLLSFTRRVSCSRGERDREAARASDQRGKTQDKGSQAVKRTYPPLSLLLISLHDPGSIVTHSRTERESRANSGSQVQQQQQGSPPFSLSCHPGCDCPRLVISDSHSPSLILAHSPLN